MVANNNLSSFDPSTLARATSTRVRIIASVEFMSFGLFIHLSQAVIVTITYQCPWKAHWYFLWNQMFSFYPNLKIFAVWLIGEVAEIPIMET